MSAFVCARSVYGFHGMSDRHGRCPWCGERVGPRLAAPISTDFMPSELTEYYEMHYDPDYGSLDHEQIRDRYQHGQNV